MHIYSSVIERIPEAKLFVKQVDERLDTYRNVDEGQFADVQALVLSGTGTDLHGEAFALEALEQMVQHIHLNGLWIRYQHDPAIQPIGRVLDANIFWDSDSECHFVVGIVVI